MIRRPAARAEFTSRALSAETRKRSGYGRSCASGEATPVCRVIGANTMPALTSCVTSADVNGRDADGISALPGSVPNTLE